MFQIAADELRDIYRLLMRLVKDDPDLEVRLHAEICLELLRENMRGLVERSIPKVQELKID